MTKRDLVKWLEAKKTEACNEAETTRRKCVDAAKEFEYANIGLDNFVNESVTILKKFIDEYGKFIDKVNNIEGMCMSRYNWKFGYHDFISKFSDATSIRDNLKEIIRIDTARYKEILSNANEQRRKVESTYDTVILTVKNLPTAKDGMEYLKKLGFDISEIEPAEKKKQLPATISVNVDVKYLLLKKKGE